MSKWISNKNFYSEFMDSIRTAVLPGYLDVNAIRVAQTFCIYFKSLQSQNVILSYSDCFKQKANIE